MRIRLLLAGMAGASAFALWPTAADARIVPGQSIAGLKLGMSEARAIEIRGTPRSARTIPEEIRGQVRELRWPGLRVILGEGSGITSITTTSRRERTRSGVGIGTSERVLRQRVRVRCSSFGSFRRCTRGVLRPGATVTDFAIGPKTRKVRRVTLGYVID